MDFDELLNSRNKYNIISFLKTKEAKELLILKERLIGRKTESKEQVIERFKTAYKEINEVSKYNYVIVNDNLDEALSKMDAIITCEKCRVDRIEDVEIGNQEEIIHEILMDFEK